MGIESSSQTGKKNIRVANINFSGYDASPFQYYSEDHKAEQKQLNAIFRAEINSLAGNRTQLFTKQQYSAMSKIDRYIKAQRYSPLYNKSCGVVKGKFYDSKKFEDLVADMKMKRKLIDEKRKNQGYLCVPQNQDEYRNKDANDKYYSMLQNLFNVSWDLFLMQGDTWNKIYKQQSSKQKSKEHRFYQFRYIKKKKQLDNLRKFDFIVFITILKYVYEKVDLETIVNSRSCAKYLQFMKKFFNKPFLDANIKILHVIKFLKEKQIDVLFVQDANDMLCRELEKQLSQYRIIRSHKRVDQVQGSSNQRPDQSQGTSLIVLKQSSFWKADVGRKGNLKIRQLIQKLGEAEKQKFLQWGKTAVISIGNFILISVTAKQFTQHMNDNIQFIKQKFPLKYVIIGATFTQGKKIEGARNLQLYYDSFPKNKITCFKKRTHIQFQQQKAHKLIAAQYNHIIYDKKLEFQGSSLAGQTIISSKIQDGVYTFDDQIIDKDAIGSSKKDQINKNQEDFDLELFPNDSHLLDQLIVIKNLTVPKKKAKKPQEGHNRKKLSQRLGFETSSSQEDAQAINNPNAYDTFQKR